MATMDHINVVRLYSVCMGKQMMLISQFVRLGSLLSFLKKNQATLDAYTMLNFSKQIADVGVHTHALPYWGGVWLHLIALSGIAAYYCVVGNSKSLHIADIRALLVQSACVHFAM